MRDMRRKPVRWWVPWRKRALRREWDRQVQVMRDLGDDFWTRLPRP